MARKEKKVFRASLVAALTLLSALAFVAGRSRSAAVSHGAMPSAPSARSAALETSYPAFTLISSRTVTLTNGQTLRRSQVQRSQRSDGIYKLVQTFYPVDGGKERLQTYFGFIGLGVFRLDEAGRRLIFKGPLIEESIGDIEQFLRANPAFAGEESVAGIRTIVWRQPGEDGPEDFFEEHRAPSLGGLVIKTVRVSGREREVFEPTAIQMGEPPANLFSELLSYPSDYSFYERRVQEVEKHNEPDAAFMRQLLERMRRVRP
ncbi:MAG TPA: hypothetical protein VEM96_06890 [Pyrinomonadaceae bacterium]|nr:hypothetical protein [Pyrinomonadaceae bacterium]